LKTLLSYAVSSVPQFLGYADRVPVVNSAVKYALPTLEPYAKSFVKLSEPVASKVDEQLSVVYKSVKETSVVKTLSSRLDVSAFQIPISNSFSTLLELSDTQVDYWLPEDDKSPSAPSEAEVNSGASKDKKQVTLTSLYTKTSKRAQKKVTTSLEQWNLWVQPKVTVSRTLVINSFQVSKQYAVKFYESPVETGKYVYSQSVVVVSDVQGRVFKYTESQRLVLSQRIKDFIAQVQKTMSEFSEKYKTVKEGKPENKIQPLKIHDLWVYALVKLRMRKVSESNGVNPQDVELTILNLIYSVGQTLYIEEIITKINALVKTATST